MILTKYRVAHFTRRKSNNSRAGTYKEFSDGRSHNEALFIMSLTMQWDWKVGGIISG